MGWRIKEKKGRWPSAEDAAALYDLVESRGPKVMEVINGRVLVNGIFVARIDRDNKVTPLVGLPGGSR